MPDPIQRTESEFDLIAKGFEAAIESDYTLRVLAERMRAAYRASFTQRDAARIALDRLRDLVHDGDMPALGNLPQTDLASRSYVRLASAVEEEWENAAAALPQEGETGCVWTMDEYMDGAYDTGCGGKWFFDTGTPAENKARYCMYCGKPLVDRAARRAT